MRYSILLDRGRVALFARLPEVTQMLTYRYETYRFIWYPIVTVLRPK